MPIAPAVHDHPCGVAYGNCRSGAFASDHGAHQRLASFGRGQDQRHRLMHGLQDAGRLSRQEVVEVDSDLAFLDFPYRCSLGHPNAGKNASGKHSDIEAIMDELVTKITAMTSGEISPTALFTYVCNRATVPDRPHDRRSKLGEERIFCDCSPETGSLELAYTPVSLEEGQLLAENGLCSSAI